MSRKCDSCNLHLTTVHSVGSYHFFYCKYCKKKFSLRNNTFLANANISLRKFVLLIYVFVSNYWTYKVIQKETDISSESDTESVESDSVSSSVLGKATISKYFNFFRYVHIFLQLIYYSIFYYFRDVIGAEMLLNESDKKIGGPGLTVEIDESMFGKRRYHRGRILGRRQMWVLGGVCRETKEVFLVPCPDNTRDKATLIPIIKEKVAPGSRIITDGWKAYQSLGEEGYDWQFVNHSENFIKPGTVDVHTNRIEGQWHCVKRTLPECGNYKLESYLPVYLWKQLCDREGKDIFWELVRLLHIHQGVFCAVDDDLVDDNESVEVQFVSCFYCGEKFRGNRGVKIHMKKCVEK